MTEHLPECHQYCCYCGPTQPFTFKLIDGRKVTYGGQNEQSAHRKARAYHGDAVAQGFGETARRCECSPKHAEPEREAGWLICRDCAGYILMTEKEEQTEELSDAGTELESVVRMLRADYMTAYLKDRHDQAKWLEDIIERLERLDHR